jgi:uncharacterized Fe-S cluster-containing radical SAM superfamily enzyme
MLSAEFIQLVSSKICYKKNYVQPFSREKIAEVRQQLWDDGDFEFKSHLKLEVHRQFRRGDATNCMVIVEGIDVVPRAGKLSWVFQRLLSIGRGMRCG